MGEGSHRAGGTKFPTTRWSVVLQAADVDSPLAREALNELCKLYWQPVHGFVRQLTRDRNKAQDLTQGFFVFLLEKNPIKVARADKGRFRSFILVLLKRYLANEHHRVHALKRGGAATTLSIDFGESDTWHVPEPVEAHTPESIFVRRWASTLIGRALTRLRKELAQTRDAEQVDVLVRLLAGGRDAARYAEIAKGLEMRESALKVAIHRTRRRYRSLLREEVAHTVADSALIDEELNALFSALAS